MRTRELVQGYFPHHRRDIDRQQDVLSPTHWWSPRDSISTLGSCVTVTSQAW